MDWSKVEQTLERYYAGDTSLKEEQELADVLSRSDAPEHLKEEAVALAFYSNTRQSSKSNIRMEAITKHSTPPAKVISLGIRQIAAAAAVLILMTSLYFSMKVSNSSREVYAVVNDQKIYDKGEAYAETVKTLAFVSEKMNAGNKYLKHLNKLEYINQ